MLRREVSIGLICLLALPGAIPAGAAQTQTVAKLNIVILEGEGAINNIRQRTAREPIVQVEDEIHRPVAGAVVLFSLPDRSASGVFANGQTSMAVSTDAQGRAVATGLRPNGVQGNLQIRVDASYQGQKTSATINQTNAPGAAAAGGISAKTIGILVAVAGAAAGGAVAATRGGKATPAPTIPTTSITAGTPSVAPPR